MTWKEMSSKKMQRCEYDQDILQSTEVKETQAQAPNNSNWDNRKGARKGDWENSPGKEEESWKYEVMETKKDGVRTNVKKYEDIKKDKDSQESITFVKVKVKVTLIQTILMKRGVEMWLEWTEMGMGLSRPLESREASGGMSELDEVPSRSSPSWDV